MDKNGSIRFSVRQSIVDRISTFSRSLEERAQTRGSIAAPASAALRLPSHSPRATERREEDNSLKVRGRMDREQMIPSVHSFA